MIPLSRSALINGGLIGTITVVVVGATVIGGFAASDGGLPLFSGEMSEQDQSLSTTQTQIATSSPTPTAASTPTATPTPSDAELRKDYESLRQRYLEHWSYLDEDHPATPALLGTDARPNQDTLWVVFDETDVHENATRMRLEWTTVSNAYLHSLESHTGHAPERMIAIGWNNTGPITYFRVETDNARALIDGDIEYNTFYNSFFRTLRPTSEGERRLARDIAEHPPDDN